MGVSPHDPMQSPVPGYALELYKLMEANAENTSDGYAVFTGSISKMYDGLGISKQHYTRIMMALVEAGAIQYMQRGNVRQPTVLRLYGEPTLLKLVEVLEINTQFRREKKSVLEQRVDALERSVAGLNVKEALLNLDNRVKEIEAKNG